VTSRNRNFVPRINPSCNLRALPLTPQDAFVLSRVDGFSSVDALGQITGLGESVVALLEKLHQFGALLEGLPEPSVPLPPVRAPSPPGVANQATSSAPGQKPPAPAAAPAQTSRPALTPPGPERATPPQEFKPASTSSVDQESLPVRSPQPPRSSRYPLAELDELVDIEMPRKVRILEVFYSLPDLTHYELLGLPSAADKKQIKSAYFELAQEFHPDRFFRKSIGSYKHKLEEIFKRVTEAHDTLTRSVSRAEYDAELKQRAEIKARVRSSAPPAPGPGTSVAPPHVGQAAAPTLTSSVYSGVTGASRNPASPAGTPSRSITPTSPLASGRTTPTPTRATVAPPGAASSGVSSSRPPQAPASSSIPPSGSPSVPPPPPGATSRTGLPPRPASQPPPRPSTNPPPSVNPVLRSGSSPPERPMSESGTFDPADQQARRQALAAKLASGRFAAPNLRASIARSEPPASIEPGPDSSANARDSLRRMQAAKGIAEAQSQFDRYLKAGEEAAARGDAVTASNSFRLALAHEPENARIKTLLAEWSAKAAVAMAAQYVKQGESEASQARWGEAARAYVRAVAGLPDDPQTLARAAEMLVLAEGDLHQAVEFARKAVMLASKTSRFRVILAEVYLAANLGLNARRELDAALKMDPTNDKVKALLKQLG
jgi:thioredoxin-like negative regulator of GroEL